jgi:hypothetical protein
MLEVPYTILHAALTLRTTYYILQLLDYLNGNVDAEMAKMGIEPVRICIDRLYDGNRACENMY